ncbi:MAG TPA: allene oxide cyclase family protein [Phototrophicaceae bacterium]|jgi:hypothetical protein|nr:allene oxide cyclase family protein [Phototrophicaceae bacterium]
MKSKAVIAVLLVVIAVLAAGMISTQAHEGENTIHVIEHATTDVVTDTGEEGDSVGDVLTFANEVFDEANATKVGTDNGYCIRTAVGAAWECHWTLTLDDGSLTVDGPFYDAGDSTLAITGGTGEYAGAKGQMQLHALNPEGTEYDFIYELGGEAKSE